MGILTLSLICCPPIITIVAVGIVLALNKLKIITVSNQQVLVFGIISFIVALTATCIFAQIVSSRLYAT